MSSVKYQVTLSDPGMEDRSFEADTWEMILEELARSASQHYTMATVCRGTEVVGWSWRQVGETKWETRKRPVTEPPGGG